jgi:type I restriction enzyme S subunit
LFKEVEQLEQLTIERITLKEKFVSALNQLTTNNIKQEWAFIRTFS